MSTKVKQVALITGASSGIGEATAQKLHHLGYTVYASARRVEKMESLAEQGIHILKLDVTDESSMISAINTIIADEGRIDVLVNNAGYGSYGPLENIPLSEGRYQFEVNLFGLARLTQLVIPHMRQQKCGRIVNVSSVGGKSGEPLGSWYHATKYAVEGLSDSLRYELKRFGIKVIIIEPGAILSEWGHIAISNLLKVSAGTAYEEHAKKHAKVLEITTDPDRAFPPEVIADEIGNAVTAKDPRIRYVAGPNAKLGLLIRKLLPDRAFDNFIEKRYNNT